VIRWLVPLALLILLGSCALGPTLPPSAPPTASPAPATVSLDRLAEVRAAAEDAGDVIHVQPLRDPAIDDLAARAAAFEAEGDIARAAATLQQALQLVPDDPQLMQEFAELLLAQDRLDDAETLAVRSFDRGPKLGGLCRRNWATVQLARQHRGDPDGAASAAAQLSRCIVEPQVRM
jgi:tetratricopeptide (TPR) repeat protein